MELIRASQPLHGELDLAAWQFAPGLDRVMYAAAGQRSSTALAGRRASSRGLLEGLSDISVIHLCLAAPGGHPVGQIFGGTRHHGTSTCDKPSALLFPALCVHLDMKQWIGKLVCDFQLPSLTRFKIAVQIQKDLAGHYRRFFPGCMLIGQFLAVAVRRAARLR
jgi:hypothetical protein